MDEDRVNVKQEFISSWPPETDCCSVNTVPLDRGKVCNTSISGNIIKTNTGCSSKKKPHKWEKVCKLPVHGKRSYADAAVARWWRQEGKALAEVEGLDLPTSSNPQTIIHCLIKSSLGQSFLQGEVKRLTHEVKHVPASTNQANRLAVLATYLEKLRLYHEANENIEKAIAQTDEADDIKEYKWIKERIKRQIYVQETQLAIKQKPDLSFKWSQYTQVERRSAHDLSCEEFFYQYALKSSPVVITDLVQNMTDVPWTLQHISEVAGRWPVTLKRLDPHSTEWARLENSKQSTVEQFVDSLDKQEGLDVHEKSYLFDWSLPLHCPRLAEELSIPKYFANDFLQRSMPGSLYRESWPSLFVAPSGVRSELHIDAFASNFWMALFQGKKRWVFFEQQAAPCLYPSYSQSMDPVFEVDLSQPDLTKHPLLQYTSPTECILKPGELLFVPAGCPHRVENLEKSLAISANFVDKSNFDKVVKELSINGLVDERSLDLVKQMTSEGFDKSMDFSVTDKKWCDFKQNR